MDDVGQSQRKLRFGNLRDDGEVMVLTVCQAR